MGKVYRKKVANLIGTLNHPDTRQEAADVIRTLVDRITVHHDKETGQLSLDLEGDLAGILNLAKKDDPKNKKGPVITEAHIDNLHSQVQLVAGVGFEPTTFRL